MLYIYIYILEYI